MNAIEQLLEEAKTKTSIKSDNALAKEIGVTRGSINHYRKGRSTPDVYTMARLADLTGRKLIQIIAMVEAEKEQPEEKKEYWKNFYKRLGGVAAGFSLIASLPFIFQAFEQSTMYIM